MILDAAVRHTLVDIVVADPTRRDLVERAARHDLVERYERMPTRSGAVLMYNVIVGAPV